MCLRRSAPRITSGILSPPELVETAAVFSLPATTFEDVALAADDELPNCPFNHTEAADDSCSLSLGCSLAAVSSAVSTWTFTANVQFEGVFSLTPRNRRPALSVFKLVLGPTSLASELSEVLAIKAPTG